MAEEEENFKNAAHKLFGNGFERTAKKRAEAVKLLKGNALFKNHQFISRFFRATPLSSLKGRRLPIFLRKRKMFQAFLSTRKRPFSNIQPK